jgi:hypothetical protein
LGGGGGGGLRGTYVRRAAFGLWTLGGSPPKGQRPKNL